MEIIFQKNETYSNGAFFYQALNDNKINGVFLNVIRTKDGRLIVVNHSVYGKYDIKNLNFSEVIELDKRFNLSVITLEDTLSALQNTRKKIVLNLIPLYLFDLTEENYEQIKNNAIKYINEFYDVIRKYPNLNIYICSRVEKTLYLIQQVIKDYKTGIVITNQNLSFTDADFYVIDMDMYDEEILTEILNLNREIMLNVLSRNNIDEAKSIFKENNITPENKIIFDNSSFITYYPNVLYQELT